MHDQTAYQIRPDLRVVCVSDESAFLITETERRRVNGRLYVTLLSALSTPFTAGDLAARLAAHHSEIEVHYGIQQLVAAGHVVDRATHVERMARSRAPAPRTAVRTLAADGGGIVARTLSECGLVVEDGAPLTVLVIDDYLHPGLTSAIDDVLAAGSACLPFKPHGSVAWLGPVFSPGAQPCWYCLLHHIQVNRPVEMYLQAEGLALEEVLPRAKYSATTLAAASLFAGCELMRRLAPSAPARCAGVPELRDLVTLDLEHMVRREHPILRRPQCPCCGDPHHMTHQLARPIELASREKRDLRDGGHRIESPDATYARLARHVDPRIGAISHLGEMPHKHHPLRPVFTATHFLRPAPGVAQDERFDQISVGKGKTIEQARVSALCEALERQCARYQGDEPRVRGSIRELAPAAIDPRSLLLFSDRQYAEGTPRLARARLLATPRSQLVPRPADPDRAIDWTPAWSLTEGTRRLVPFHYVFAGAPQPVAERCCMWDSNGCAAGNCLEEAVLQGLLELVERDATAIWWYNRVARPEVDLDSFAQPYFHRVRAHYGEAGHQLWVLDLTHDLGIPAVIALARERHGDRYAAGLGCHLDLELAVQRALTELHQVFDPEHRHDPLFVQSEIGDDRFLRPAPDLAPCTAASHANQRCDDLREDIALCMQRLRRAGLDVIVADYSRPDVALTTVKVMVPGLRHFWPRFAPGRLYDVPVALGWRSSPYTEGELNPMPLLM